MSDGYFTKRLDHSVGYIDLWKTPELEQEQAKSMCQFMSVGLGGLQRYRARQLEKAILKKHRAVIVKLFRPLALNRKFLKRIGDILQRSGLSLARQLQISKALKRMLLDFIRDRHTLLQMSPSMLNSLPNELRQFVIALMVLKAEIANLHRLEMEREFNNRNLEFNRPRTTKLSRYKPYRGLTHHRDFATGVSLTAGTYAGIIGSVRKTKRKENNYKKTYKKNVNKRSRDNKKTFYRAWNNYIGKGDNQKKVVD